MIIDKPVTFAVLLHVSPSLGITWYLMGDSKVR
jgi:hypothetical protein